MDDFEGAPGAEQLHFAAQDGDLERVRDLVEQGHDINAFDDLGMTALHYAVKSERFDVVQYLLDQGADVNAHHEPGIGNTPLGEVAENCSLRMAKLLVDAGADPTIAGWMQLTAVDKSKNRIRGEGPHVHDLLVRAALKRVR